MERGGGKNVVEVIETGLFLAAVLKMWLLSHSGTGGDSSLYHSAVCYFV